VGEEGSAVASSALRVGRRAALAVASLVLAIAARAEQAHPWPSFRHDLRNSGRATFTPRAGSGHPWSFATGKGIFSTPVIDRDGIVYVGSADRSFYAVGPDGRERWRFETGEIIDSAGALSPFDPARGFATVTFGSGDGFVRQLRTGAVADPSERLRWTFDARSAPGPGFNHWFEANVVRLPDGSFLAGNTNFRYYALSPEGHLAWSYTTGSNAWSAAAQDADGTLFWGSLDGFLHAVDPGGRLRWKAPTLGFVAASAAVDGDGTVYVGSFDGGIYAFAASGRALPWPLPRWRLPTWRFATQDHVYGSPALREDAAGRIAAIYATSTDGALYALAPDGRLLWRHDVGDPIRSSPVLGRAPDGGGEIVYFGAGDGRLYAVDADSGRRRWSFDTTPDDPELRDRNDLNASPALGPDGIAIGGEHGLLWLVPYDYCLRAEDPRCRRGGDDSVPPDGASLAWITPGGTALGAPPDRLPAAAVVTLRLRVHRGGEAVDAAFCGSRWRCGDGVVSAEMSPPVPLQTEISADGRHLHVIPEAPLAPGSDVRLRIHGAWLEGRTRVGNLALFGSEAGRFEHSFELHVEPSAARDFPLHVGADAVGAVAWRRLAVSLPTMMPSLNQIGFDSYDWILSVLARSEADAEGGGRILLFALGARRDAQGRIEADPGTDFAFPLAGTFRGESFVAANRAFVLRVTEVPIPFDRFALRGTLGSDGRVLPGASVWATSDCLSIPNYGPRLVLGGLCNGLYRRLVTSGTYVTRALPPEARPARRPEGLDVAEIAYEPPANGRAGSVRARLAADPLQGPKLAEHRASLLLVDAVTLEPVALGAAAHSLATADARGLPATIGLELPAGIALPEATDAIVVWDAFPLLRQRIPRR
jgi:outer membrane protein assembly factor BamB